ncbi:MAG: beta-propeller domain-containing protein [Eubacterium sp.]|nr:beta-propeller domain-containing protein [Eubacterium sp.]
MNKNFQKDINEENLKIAEEIKRNSDELEVPKHQSFEELLEKSSPKRNWKKISRYGAVAAIFVAIVSAGIFAEMNRIDYLHNDKMETVAKKQPGTEEKIHVASSYDEVYDALEKAHLEMQREERHRPEYSIEDEAVGSNNIEGIAPKSEKSGLQKENKVTDDDESSYSKTNVQTENVDEDDIVKTNGKYIYTFHLGEENSNETKGGCFTISQVNGTVTKTISKIYIPQFFAGHSDSKWGMYLYENTLVIVGTPSGMFPKYEGVRASNYESHTVIFTYDVSTPETPKLISTNTQDGNYVSSRLKGKYLYTISNRRIYDYNIEEKDKTKYLPTINRKCEPIDCIYVPEGVHATGFTVVTVLDLTDSNDFKKSKSIMGDSNQIYASNENLYVINNTEKRIEVKAEKKKSSDDDFSNAVVEDYVYDYLKYKHPLLRRKDIRKKRIGKTEKLIQVVNIVKYHCTEGRLEFVAETETEGRALDNLFFDEKDGYLRFVVEKNEEVYSGYENKYYDKKNKLLYSYFEQYDWSGYGGEVSTSVVVLDETLKKVASVDGLAKGEDLYSARYRGDYGYFVTFEETDPLFTVDFTDMKHPKIMDALEMPGYSSYLHFYDDNLLFGLGEEQIEGYSKMKLEMYDISANKAKQKTKLVIGENDRSEYDAPSLRDYKSLLIDTEKNYIGFVLSEWNYHYKEEMEGYHYLLYQYKNNEFECIADIKIKDVGWAEGESIRGLYIDHYFHVVVPNYGIYSIDLDTYEQNSKVEYENI